MQRATPDRHDFVSDSIYMKGSSIVALMSIRKFERLFREGASLDTDKKDLRRYEELIAHKTHDLLLLGQAQAKANGRDVIEPFDLPVTKGLQKSVHAFRDINKDIDLQGILDQMTPLPPLDLEYSDDMRAQLPEVAGGLSVALAHSLKIVEPNMKDPVPGHWDRAFACSMN
jgi:hypothetical protein